MRSTTQRGFEVCPLEAPLMQNSSTDGHRWPLWPVFERVVVIRLDHDHCMSHYGLRELSSERVDQQRQTEAASRIWAGRLAASIRLFRRSLIPSLARMTRQHRPCLQVRNTDYHGQDLPLPIQVP